MKVPVLYIMGNDDWVELPEEKPLRSIHGHRVELGRFNFVGYQYTLPFMGGIFERPEAEIANDLASLEHLVDERTVFVTHSPAKGTLDLGVLDNPAGSDSIRSLVERCSPRAHIHGHIHGCFGRAGRHFNVAAGAAMRAMVLDLDSMEHQIISQ